MPWLTACLCACSAYSLILKMEAICSSEMSVNFYQTARHHTPWDGALHSRCHENIRSCNKIICLKRVFFNENRKQWNRRTSNSFEFCEHPMERIYPVLLITLPVYFFNNIYCWIIQFLFVFSLSDLLFYACIGNCKWITDCCCQMIRALKFTCFKLDQ
jgi:hypothetical protein